MGYCEICYAACESRYCAGCAPSAPAAAPQVLLKREARLDGHSDRVYDIAWGSNNRLASVGQVGGFVWSIPVQKHLRAVGRRRVDARLLARRRGYHWKFFGQDAGLLTK